MAVPADATIEHIFETVQSGDVGVQYLFFSDERLFNIFYDIDTFDDFVLAEDILCHSELSFKIFKSFYAFKL